MPTLTIIPLSLTNFPPLHLWPRPLKNLLLGLATLMVILAYLLLGGTVLALFAVFFEIMK